MLRRSREKVQQFLLIIQGLIRVVNSTCIIDRMEKRPSSRSIFQSSLQMIATPPLPRSSLSLRVIQNPLGQTMWVGCIGLSQVSVKKHRSQLLVINLAARAGKASILATDLVLITMQSWNTSKYSGSCIVKINIPRMSWPGIDNNRNDSRLLCSLQANKPTSSLSAGKKETKILENRY